MKKIVLTTIMTENKFKDEFGDKSIEEIIKDFKEEFNDHEGVEKIELEIEEVELKS